MSVVAATFIANSDNFIELTDQDCYSFDNSTFVLDATIHLTSLKSKINKNEYL